MRKFLFISIPLLILILVGVPLGSLFIMKSINTSILTQISSQPHITILQSHITSSLLTTQAEISLKLSDESKKLLTQSEIANTHSELIALLDEPISLHLTLSNNLLAKNWLTGTAQAGQNLAKYLSQKPLSEFYIPLELTNLIQKNATLYAKLNDIAALPLPSNAQASLQDSSLTLSIVDSKPDELSLSTRIHQTQSQDLPATFTLSLTLQGENLKAASIQVPHIPPKADKEFLDLNDVELGISATKPIAILPLKDMILTQIDTPQPNTLAGMVSLLNHIHLLGDNTYTATISAKAMQTKNAQIQNLEATSSTAVLGNRADTTSTMNAASIITFGDQVGTLQDVKFNMELGIDDFASFIKMNDEIESIESSETADEAAQDKILANFLEKHFFLDKLNFSMQGNITDEKVELKNFSFESSNTLADNILKAQYAIGIGKLTPNEESEKDFTLSNGRAEASLSLDNFQEILLAFANAMRNQPGYDEKLYEIFGDLFHLKALSLNANADIESDGVKLSGIRLTNSNTFNADDITLNLNADIADISSDKLDDLHLKFGGASVGLEISDISRHALSVLLQNMVQGDELMGERNFEALSIKLPSLRVYDTYITLNDRFEMNGTIKTKSLVSNAYDLDLKLMSSKNPVEVLPLLAMLPQLKGLKPQMGQYVIRIHGLTPHRVMINDKPLDGGSPHSDYDSYEESPFMFD